MSLKRNYGFNLLNSLLNIVFPIITFPYAARILSPEGIGQTQFTFSFAQYFAIIAAFGIPIYGVKAVSETRGKKEELSKVTSELLLISLILALVVLAIYVTLISSIPTFKENYSNYLLAGALILFSFLNVDWFFSGIEEFKVIAMRSAAVKLLSLIILFSLVKSQSNTSEYLIFLVFLYVGNYVLNFFFLIKKVKISLSNVSMQKHWKPLLLILSMTIATTIYTTLDTVLLGFLSDNEEVGYYTAAVKLSKVTIPILTSMGVVIIPRATRLLQNKDHLQESQLYAKSFSFLMLLAVPMTFGLYLLNEETILIFSGAEFSNAIEDVRFLSFLPLFIGIGHFASFQILIPYNKHRGMFISTLAGMFVFGALCLWLVPTYGSTGSSVANSVTELVVTTCYFLFIPKRIIQNLPWSKLLKAVLASLIFIPLILLIKSVIADPVLIFLSSAILCALSYFIIQRVIFHEVLIKEIIAYTKKKSFDK